MTEASYHLSGLPYFHWLLRQAVSRLPVTFALVVTRTGWLNSSLAMVNAEGDVMPNFQYWVHGTPCVWAATRTYCFFPCGVAKIFQADTVLTDMRVESYGSCALTPRSAIIFLHHANWSSDELDAVMAFFKLVRPRAGAEISAYLIAQYAASPGIQVPTSGAVPRFAHVQSLLSRIGQVFGHRAVCVWRTSDARDSIDDSTTVSHVMSCLLAPRGAGMQTIDPGSIVDVEYPVQGVDSAPALSTFPRIYAAVKASAARDRAPAGSAGMAPPGASGSGDASPDLLYTSSPWPGSGGAPDGPREEAIGVWYMSPPEVFASRDATKVAASDLKDLEGQCLPAGVGSIAEAEPNAQVMSSYEDVTVARAGCTGTVSLTADDARSMHRTRDQNAMFVFLPPHHVLILVTEFFLPREYFESDFEIKTLLSDLTVSLFELDSLQSQTDALHDRLLHSLTRGLAHDVVNFNHVILANVSMLEEEVNSAVALTPAARTALGGAADKSHAVSLPCIQESIADISASTVEITALAQKLMLPKQDVVASSLTDPFSLLVTLAAVIHCSGSTLVLDLQSRLNAPHPPYALDITRPISTAPVDCKASVPDLICSGNVGLFQTWLSNMIHNATLAVQERLAMDPDAPDGVILVSCRRREVALSEILQCRCLPPKPVAGTFVHLVVRDNGGGIKPDVLPTLFKGRVTTRKTGHGVGLASGQALCEHYGCAINVRSVPGKGAVFETFMPVIRS